MDNSHDVRTNDLSIDNEKAIVAVLKDRRGWAIPFPLECQVSNIIQRGEEDVFITGRPGSGKSSSMELATLVALNKQTHGDTLAALDPALSAPERMRLIPVHIAFNHDMKITPTVIYIAAAAEDAQRTFANLTKLLSNTAVRLTHGCLEDDETTRSYLKADIHKMQRHGCEVLVTTGGRLRDLLGLYADQPSQHVFNNNLALLCVDGANRLAHGDGLQCIVNKLRGRPEKRARFCLAFADSELYEGHFLNIRDLCSSRYAFVSVGESVPTFTHAPEPVVENKSASMGRAERSSQRSLDDIVLHFHLG